MPDEARSREAAGGYGNFVLYRMCADEPGHDDLAVVRSKARTIAKVYEVSRNLGKDYTLIAKVLCAKKLALDDLLKDLSRAEFSEETLSLIVNAHQKVDMALCRKLEAKSDNRAVHSRASFVSKYLHFHRPDTFPILDSIAEKDLQSRVGRLPRSEFGLTGKSARYERFCRGILVLQSAKKFRTKSLREIDDILLDKIRS